MREQDIKNAVARIDNVLGKRQIEPALTRQEHLQLAQDLSLLQASAQRMLELEVEMKIEDDNERTD